MRWERVVKDDSVRSCLLELRSFLLSKPDVNPIHRVLMFLPYFLLVPSKTRCIQDNYIWIFVILIHRIHGCEEYRLSFCSNFVLLVSILNWWWKENWLHIRCDKCTRRNCSEFIHCPKMKDQWDCVLNVLEEHEDKSFVVEMDQYNIEIFSICFRLLSLYSSTFHQTNVEIAQYHSEDIPWISRIQLLTFFSNGTPWRRRVLSRFDTVNDGRIIFWVNISPLSFTNW